MIFHTRILICVDGVTCLHAAVCVATVAPFSCTVVNNLLGKQTHSLYHPYCRNYYELLCLDVCSVKLEHTLMQCDFCFDLFYSFSFANYQTC